MYIKEEKEITISQEIITGIKCDVCGKIHYGDTMPDNWHVLSMHHIEWGWDNVDSYESFHVCSPNCYAVKFKKCVEELKDISTAEIDGFNIQFAVLFANSL